MIKLDEYSEGYSFPNQLLTDPKAKDADYHKSYCEAIYSAHIQNKTSLRWDWFDSAQILRDYGTGTQSEDYYLEQMEGENNGITASETLTQAFSDRKSQGQRDRKGYKNLNTKIISVARNLKSVIHGMFEEQEQDIFVNCVDPKSDEYEENAKWEAYIEATMSKEFQMHEEMAGLTPTQNQTNFSDDVTPEELDQYKALGGFKANWAIAMEELLKYTSIVSDWDMNIKRKYIDDMLDLNIIAGRCVYDSEDMKLKWEYIDPATFVIQYSKERDFSDAEFAGYYKIEKISDLVNKGFSADELRPVAQRFSEQFGNPAKSEWEKYDQPSNNGTFRWFDFRVPVLHASWIDTDVDKKLKITTKYGKTKTVPLGWEEAPQPLRQRDIDRGYQQEVVNTNIRYVYSASWVIGSNLVYDYGKMKNQARKSKKKPMLPFFCYRGITTNQNVVFGSLIESVIPHLDALQLAWLKLQDGMAKAFPDGMAINLRLLNGLNMAGQKISDAKAVEMFKKTLVFPYMDVTPGQSYRGGDVLPLHKIPGGVGAILQEAIQVMQMNLQMIERITGISPNVLGSMSTGQQTATETQASVRGSMAVLQPYLNGIFNMKEKLAMGTVRMAPIYFRNIKGLAKQYYSIIGSQDAEFIKQVDKVGIEYGLSLEARPSVEDRQELIQYIQVAIQPGRNGEAQLDVAQGMKLIGRIKSGSNIKQLWMEAEMMIKKEQRRKLMERNQAIQLQGQQNMQLKQAEMQGRAQEEQKKVLGDMAKQYQASKLKREEMLYEHNLESNKRINELADQELINMGNANNSITTETQAQ